MVRMWKRNVSMKPGYYKMLEVVKFLGFLVMAMLQPGPKR